MKIKINVCDARFLLRILRGYDTPRSRRIHDSIFRQLSKNAKAELSKDEYESYVNFLMEKSKTIH